MVPSEWSENEVEPNLLAFLVCLHWGPYVYSDQQEDISGSSWVMTILFDPIPQFIKQTVGQDHKRSHCMGRR
jgi:hypothetical protein